MNWLGAAGGLFGGGTAGGGGGGGYSSASASTDVNQRGAGSGINVGGLNTGAQGVDLKSLAIVASVAVVGLLVLRK